MLDKSLPLSAIKAQIRFLQGSVLTIVDASYSSPEQNKAIKDLIKSAFNKKLSWIESLASGRTNGGTLYHYDGLQEGN